MIRDVQVAKQIGDLMLRVSGELDQSVSLVQDSCTAEEFERYRSGVGAVLGAMFDIVYGVYQMHPELRPAGGRGWVIDRLFP